MSVPTAIEAVLLTHTTMQLCYGDCVQTYKIALLSHGNDTRSCIAMSLDKAYKRIGIKKVLHMS